MLAPIKLRQPRYFVAVAESSNISTAAKKIFLTQPALDSDKLDIILTVASDTKPHGLKWPPRAHCLEAGRKSKPSIHQPPAHLAQSNGVRTSAHPLPRRFWKLTIAKPNSACDRIQIQHCNRTPTILLIRPCGSKLSAPSASWSGTSANNEAGRRASWRRKRASADCGWGILKKVRNLWSWVWFYKHCERWRSIWTRFSKGTIPLQEGR